MPSLYASDEVPGHPSGTVDAFTDYMNEKIGGLKKGVGAVVGGLHSSWKAASAIALNSTILRIFSLVGITGYIVYRIKLIDTCKKILEGESYTTHAGLGREKTPKDKAWNYLADSKIGNSTYKETASEYQKSLINKYKQKSKPVVADTNLAKTNLTEIRTTLLDKENMKRHFKEMDSQTKTLSTYIDDMTELESRVDLEIELINTMRYKLFGDGSMRTVIWLTSFINTATKGVSYGSQGIEALASKIKPKKAQKFDLEIKKRLKWLQKSLDENFYYLSFIKQTIIDDK